jgi:hypothetical protein
VGAVGLQAGGEALVLERDRRTAAHPQHRGNLALRQTLLDGQHMAAVRRRIA